MLLLCARIVAVPSDAMRTRAVMVQPDRKFARRLPHRYGVEPAIDRVVVLRETAP